MCGMGSVQLLATASFFVSSTLGAGEYVAASPEPAPNETRMVDLLNRVRADPKAGAGRIAPPGIEGGHAGVDGNMFRPEPSSLPGVPPVGINLERRMEEPVFLAELRAEAAGQ